MLTEKDYCDYDTCVALEELGYPRYHYDNGGELDKILRMVTLYNAQKWLREEKEFYVFVGREWGNAYYYWLSKKVEDKTVGITHSFYYSNEEGQFSSYEEALSEGIKEAVELLKEE